LAVLPHLHYLGKEVQGYAMLPNGRKQWLLRIDHWDFNWQSEYRYRQPVYLPQGSVVHMQYTYDNSAANPRNPHHPPERVVYGPQSIDEMGELWLQVLPRRQDDLPTLEAAHRIFSNRETVAYYQNFLNAHGDDALAHLALGKALGPLGRTAEAAREFRKAIELKHDLTAAHYYLALLCLTDGDQKAAQAEFQATLQLDPNYYKAHDGLGMLFLKQNEPARAETEFKAALDLNPQDVVARRYLHQTSESSQSITE
jgi:tetratricopeptide (TPR) repeat protein